MMVGPKTTIGKNIRLMEPLPLCLLGNGFSLGVQKMGIGLLNGWPQYVIAFPSLGDINSSF